MQRTTLMLTALALVLGGAGQAKADLGVDFTSTPGDFGASVYNLGYEFQANSNVTVTGLANVYLGVAYPQAQQVGLWTASGTLLASAYVTQSDPLAGSGYWRVASITPVTLTAGQDYVVGAQGGAEYISETPISVNPNITYLAYDYTTIGTTSNDPLVMPNSLGGYNNTSMAGDFGGNVVLSNVPEPSGIALLGLGVVCLAVGATARKRILALAA